MSEAAEAAAFRRLLAHLQKRSDVQNIEMMTLTGFCRNCLADWYREAVLEEGVVLDKEQSRAHVYGMPSAEWKARFQRESTPEQVAAFKRAQADNS